MATRDNDIPLFHVLVGNDVAVELDFTELFPVDSVIALGGTTIEDGAIASYLTGYTGNAIAMVTMRGLAPGETLVTVKASTGLHTDSLQFRLLVEALS